LFRQNRHLSVVLGFLLDLLHFVVSLGPPFCMEIGYRATRIVAAFTENIQKKPSNKPDSPPCIPIN
jgi:hypothetical protein